MEIDITSIIIAIVSLATFAVPIGYDQMKVKRAANKARQHFFDAASSNGFQYTDFDILGNSATIGIGNNNDEVLYVKDSHNYHLLDLRNITSCGQYRSQKKITANDHLDQTIIEKGLRISYQNGEEIKLPVFEGRDGTQRGDESVIVERWMSRINAARKHVKQVIPN